VDTFFDFTQERWKEIARGFHKYVHFSNCLDVIDVRLHVRIRKPKNSVSLLCNYKNFFSIVLLAIVNANYKLIYIHVKRESRTQIWEGVHFFERSNYNTQLRNNKSKLLIKIRTLLIYEIVYF
jgi:hypothetical protein